MKIRPRIIKADSGIKFTPANANGANWRQLVFDKYRLHLLDQLSLYGEGDDYGDWLNEMQSRHANLYRLAVASGDWQLTAYKSDEVGKYQHDYRGDLRFGTIQLKPGYNYDFNQSGILNAQNSGRYDFFGNQRRIELDRAGNQYTVDNLYSAITDDRRLLGRKGDWDENSEEFKNWKAELNKRGWDTYLDTSDDYYKLKRFNNTQISQDSDPTQPTPEETELATQVETGHKEGGYGFDWSKLGEAALKVFSNPNLYAVGRLAGNLINNERVYGEQLKGIKPTLKLTYNTYRQVVGDEATKLGYYRRAAQGQTRAARPFTSDADRLVAYLMEAKRVGDELRAQGDLADNQEIRRTSDESNQHLWNNLQRATEVANANIASINLANSLRHNLLALKHSAQWSSSDNLLQGIEYRKRQLLAENLALEDQIYTLQHSGYLYTPKYQLAYKKYNDVLEKHKKADGTYDYSDSEVLKARAEWNDYITNLKIQLARELQAHRRNRNVINFAKEGTKVTHKKKDDLLYKSTKDVVEHFRKMSKLSSEALNRKTPKIEKLTSHPKRKTKKYLLGGVAPFTVYKPVALGGETTTSSSASTSSTRGGSTKDSNGLDLLKELFKSLLTEGLPSDVNGIYAAMNALMLRQEMFGTELSTDDIASMYIQQMLKINTIKFNKALFDDASKIVHEKGADNEFAIDARGRIAVQNLETGEVTYKTLKEIEEGNGKFNPLTNRNLLNLRAYSPSLAFDYNMLEVASNATSMEEIGKFLKAQLPKIGNNELTIEGYTKRDFNLIKGGLLILKDAPEGDYKFSETKKNYSPEQLTQVKMAIEYLKASMPRNMKTLLDVNSRLQGISSNDYIAMMVSSTIDTNYKYELDAVTGKGAKDGNGNSKGDGDSTNSAGLAFVLGQGPREWIEFNTGTSNAVKALGIKGVLLNHSLENLGLGATLLDATKSQQGGYLLWNKATFGGSKLNSNAYNHIILNDSTIMGVDLPYNVDLNGNEIPDFLLLKRMEEADQEIRLNNIQNNDYVSINAIYLKHLLPPKYTQDGNLNIQNYKRFAAILVTLDEQSLQDKNSILSDEVALAGEIERDLYELSMKKQNKEYSLSDGMWLTGWGADLLYKGTIFIPYDEDITFAAISSGKPFKLNLPDNTAVILLMLYAPATLNYKSPNITLSQIKNN